MCIRGLACTPDGVWELDPAPLWAAALAAKGRGVPACTLAAGFHAALAAGLTDLVMNLLPPQAPCPPGFTQPLLRTVVLGGGVMANDLLVSALVARLEAVGLRVLRPAFAPPGDGGLALGQAVITAARARMETR